MDYAIYMQLKKINYEENNIKYWIAHGNTLE